MSRGSYCQKMTMMLDQDPSKISRKKDTRNLVMEVTELFSGAWFGFIFSPKWHQCSLVYRSKTVRQFKKNVFFDRDKSVETFLKMGRSVVSLIEKTFFVNNQTKACIRISKRRTNIFPFSLCLSVPVIIRSFRKPQKQRRRQRR